VELSGLIFVALALVWAVVLIPKALKHHDEVAKTRSVDQVSDTGRVLARREALSESRPVVPPQPVALASEPAVPDHRPAGPATRLAAHRRAAKAAARRRRRIVGFLVAATAVVGGLSVAGILLPWAAAVPAGATLAFLLLARFMVRREHARWEAAVEGVRRDAVGSEADAEPAAAPAGVPQVAVSEPRAVEKVVVGPVLDTHVAPAIVSGLDETSAYPVALLRDSEPAADGANLWDPLPVTLPTYVSKPRATRSVRTVDLADPRVSSSGRDAADSALVAEAATAAPPADGSPRRAVGG
jgi:hypothetical protein